MSCSSCAGLTRASIKRMSSQTWMDCRVRPGNDNRGLHQFHRIVR
jgi:hypothetical protein